MSGQSGDITVIRFVARLLLGCCQSLCGGADAAKRQKIVDRTIGLLSSQVEKGVSCPAYLLVEALCLVVAARHLARKVSLELSKYAIYTLTGLTAKHISGNHCCKCCILATWSRNVKEVMSRSAGT